MLYLMAHRLLDWTEDPMDPMNPMRLWGSPSNSQGQVALSVSLPFPLIDPNRDLLFFFYFYEVFRGAEYT